MKLTTIIGIGIAAVCLMVGSAASANLIQNSGMESGYYVGYGGGQHGSETGSFSVYNASMVGLGGHNFSSNAAMLCADQNAHPGNGWNGYGWYGGMDSSGVDNIVLLAPNTIYEIGSWIKTLGTGFDGTGGIDQYVAFGFDHNANKGWIAPWTVNAAVVVDTELANWTKISTTFTSGSVAEWLCVGMNTRFSQNAGWTEARALVDDVYVEAIGTVPEPGSLAAMLGSIVAMGGYAIRRRKIALD